MRKWDCIYPCPLQRLSLDGNSSCVEPRDSYQGWQMLPGILTLQLGVKHCPITKGYIFCCLAKSGERFLRLKNYFLTSAGPWRTKHTSCRLYMHCRKCSHHQSCLTLLSLGPIMMQFCCEIMTISDIAQWYFTSHGNFTHPFLTPLTFF